MIAKRGRAWRFTMYTAAEWEAIERAHQPAGTGPLTEDEMGLLYFGYSLYRGGQNSDFWQMMCRWDREDCQRWRKIANHLAEAKKHLDVLEEYSDLTNHVARDVLASVD